MIFVESLHYFPFILLNLVVALRNIDGAMEESAQNLGASGLRLFRRIVFPLAMPGLRRGRVARVREGVRRPRHAARARHDQHAGAAGLPAHHVGRHRGSDRLRDQRDHDRVLGGRAVAVGADPQGARLRDAAARRHVAAAARAHGRGRRSLAYALDRRSCCCSCSRRTWASCSCRSRRSGASACCPRASRSHHYATVFTQSPRMIGNTLLYCGSPRCIDVILGTAIAYIILRTRLPGRQLLDWRRVRGARDSRRGARDRLPAHLPRARAAVHRDSAFTATWVALDARLRGAAPALRAALVHGGAAADARLARGGGARTSARRRRARCGASWCR